MKTAPITEDVLAKITLHRGHGQKAPNGTPIEDTAGCFIDWASWLHRGVWKDSDPSISPVLQRFCITLNDRWDDEARQWLKPYIPRVLGTASADPEVDRRRGFLAADWAIRTVAPMWFRAAGKDDEAAKLESLSEIRTAEDARAARALIDPKYQGGYWTWRANFRAEFKQRYEAELKERGVADADADADAVADADAAADAVADAVAAAVAAAVADAAADADDGPTGRYWAVYNAVYKALKERRSGQFGETIVAVQKSALELLDRMIDVKVEQAA